MRRWSPWTTVAPASGASSAWALAPGGATQVTRCPSARSCSSVRRPRPSRPARTTCIGPNGIPRPRAQRRGRAIARVGHARPRGVQLHISGAARTPAARRPKGRSGVQVEAAPEMLLERRRGRRLRQHLEQLGALGDLLVERLAQQRRAGLEAGGARALADEGGGDVHTLVIDRRARDLRPRPDGPGGAAGAGVRGRGRGGRSGRPGTRRGARRAAPTLRVPSASSAMPVAACQATNAARWSGVSRSRSASPGRPSRSSWNASRRSVRS